MWLLFVVLAARAGRKQETTCGCLPRLERCTINGTGLSSREGTDSASKGHLSGGAELVWQLLRVCAVIDVVAGLSLVT